MRVGGGSAIGLIDAFQERCPKYRWEFPRNSTWIVFTDMVPRDALLLLGKAPAQILEELSGAPLTH